MPSAEVLDFARLLEPIPGDSPTGADLRADPSPGSAYYAVKDGRNQARAAERQIMLDGEETASPPDWKPVIRHAIEALADKSKDLEITAYLIEALVRQHGFAGLRDGFRLARELAERYWDGLYPTPDDEGLTTRVAPLTGLNGDDAEGTLINPIARVPLTEGSSHGPYAYYHYQQAGALSQVADEEARNKRLQAGAASMDMLEKAVAETPAAFFVNLVEDLSACQEEFERLRTLLDDKCNGQGPPASNIRAALTACLDTVKALARDKLAVAVPPPEAPAGGDGRAAEPPADGQAAGPLGGPLRSRDEAFRTLLQVAEYFRKYEPHSPVSYALEQAVRWGQMSLPELLSELIPDEGPRQHLFKQVGIRT
jgi:type VI secretion system protein ImpA